jgi:hypothetical protein
VTQHEDVDAQVQCEENCRNTEGKACCGHSPESFPVPLCEMRRGQQPAQDVPANESFGKLTYDKTRNQKM